MDRKKMLESDECIQVRRSLVQERDKDSEQTSEEEEVDGERKKRERDAGMCREGRGGWDKGGVEWLMVAAQPMERCSDSWCHVVKAGWVIHQHHHAATAELSKTHKHTPRDSKIYTLYTRMHKYRSTKIFTFTSPQCAKASMHTQKKSYPCICIYTRAVRDKSAFQCTRLHIRVRIRPLVSAVHNC